MRDFIIKTNIVADNTRILVAKILEMALESRFPRPHDRELDLHRGDDPLDRVGKNIEPLLSRKAAYNTDDRDIFIHIESEPFLQFTLAESLSVKLAHRKICRKQRILSRIPESRIDSVQDAYIRLSLSAQKVVQAASEIGIQRLLSIFGAYGGNKIGEEDPALQEVDPAEILKNITNIEIPGKPQYPSTPEP